MGAYKIAVLVIQLSAVPSEQMVRNWIKLLFFVAKCLVAPGSFPLTFKLDVSVDGAGRGVKDV